MPWKSNVGLSAEALNMLLLLVVVTDSRGQLFSRWVQKPAKRCDPDPLAGLPFPVY